MNSVWPQQDGPDIAIKSWSLVETISLIALGLEVGYQLCKRGAKTKMLTPHNPIEKHEHDKRYCNKKNYDENLSKINNFWSWHSWTAESLFLLISIKN